MANAPTGCKNCREMDATFSRDGMVAGVGCGWGTGVTGLWRGQLGQKPEPWRAWRLWRIMGLSSPRRRGFRGLRRASGFPPAREWREAPNIGYHSANQTDQTNRASAPTTSVTPIFFISRKSRVHFAANQTSDRRVRHGFQACNSPSRALIL